MLIRYDSPWLTTKITELQNRSEYFTNIVNNIYGVIYQNGRNIIA
jgi:hypothetical protein